MLQLPLTEREEDWSILDACRRPCRAERAAVLPATTSRDMPGGGLMPTAGGI
ncbi:unnamed protein product [Ectocarpus sp. CCAP 1310/34]|nr:unnamed protein product [Ectocarpus sp. CCAP 1310/34]